MAKKQDFNLYCLPCPVVCECGFSTMDAREAIKHVKEHHPECWKDEDEFIQAQAVIPEPTDEDLKRDEEAIHGKDNS